MHNTQADFGSIIRQRRELLGLLQPQLAALSGISTRTIQLVELGKANPSLTTLTRLADPLGLSLQLNLKEPSKNNDR